MGKGKLIIFCAPSGTGKSTIVKWLMTNHPELNLHFSISATSRKPRGTEKDGVEYFFKTPEQFRQLIKEDAFIEYEEVFHDKFYGTLKSQVESQLTEGDNIIFDIDVNGGERIKAHYKDEALSLFILPPSIEALRERLTARGTESPEMIEERVARAEYEIGESSKFDFRVVNDKLQDCQSEVFAILQNFLK